MGKWKFIFEYDKYIENIFDRNIEDDSHICDLLKDTRLVEGLIKTHPSNTTIDIINRRFSEVDSSIEPDGEIYIEGDFDVLGKYLPIFTNLGYFISKVTFDGSNWENQFTEESKPIALFLEPKYDIKIEPIPPTLYHTSPSKYDSKISKIGFIPKTGNKRSNHPDRIYLTHDINVARSFGQNLKKEYNEDFSIYKINTDNLNINLYQDVNLKGLGYYTLSNISPEFFERIT